MGQEFEKVSMPAWKRTTKKGKCNELECKKAFQKKGEPKRNFLHTPLNQKSMKRAILS